MSDCVHIKDLGEALLAKELGDITILPHTIINHRHSLFDSWTSWCLTESLRLPVGGTHFDKAMSKWFQSQE